MGINVNYYDQVVYITSPTTQVTVQEIYDALREAEDSSEGIAFGGPVKSITDGFVDGEGEADVGGGFTNPLTITLDSVWYIEFWDGVGLGTVADGNISGGKDSRPIRCAVGSADTALVLGAERGIQTAGAVSQQDINDIVDAVWDEDVTEHTDANSTGEALEDASVSASETWDELTADHTIVGTYGNEIALRADIQAAVSTTSTIATSGSVIYGTETSGTWASTQNRDNIYWHIDEVIANGITVELVFNIPDDEIAGVVRSWGRYDGTPQGEHYMELWAYNYEASAYEQLEEVYIPGGSLADDEYIHEYYERNIDRDNNNEVIVRIVHNITSYSLGHDLFLDSVDVTSVDTVTTDDIADAVWDEALTDHVGSGSFGSIFGKMWRKIKFIVGEI